jgi:Cytochrome c554 and c-prime
MSAIGNLENGLQPPGSILVCYDGDQQQAETFARKYPQIRVLVYRSTSDPPAEPEKVGNTLLVTPGFHGKNVVTLTFEDGKLDGYSATSLGPDFKNDPDVSAIYSDYLHRLDSAHLLQELPRFTTALYAGSASCRNCHEKAYETWAGSGHAHAYKDLNAQGHGLDPDCVSCHVVGLSSKSGFKTLSQTPQFANVGCESCHGPGQAHDLNPRKVLMPTVKPSTCVSCHTVENSPGFEYKTFWTKVSH